MKTEFRVVFDGDSPVFKAHRLSIAELGQPLRLLLAALRRTASGILTAATDAEYGSRGGRNAEPAKLIDLELETIKDGCTDLGFVVTSKLRGMREDLLSDLSDAAVIRLVEDLESEALGRPRSSAARKYLASLPEGVTSQRYSAIRDGKEVASVQIGRVNVPVIPPGLSTVRRGMVTLTALGVEPGREYIRFKEAGDRRVQVSATAEQIASAIALRSQSVFVTYLLAPQRARLLRIDAAEIAATASQRWNSVSQRWNVVAKRLAK